MLRLTNKGSKVLRNCGAASVGEYNKIIFFYQLSNLVTVKSFRADALSVSSSSERMRATFGNDLLSSYRVLLHHDSRFVS